MGLLVAMGAPVAQNVVSDLSASAEKRASHIEPASGIAQRSIKHPHEKRQYNG
jgi:hypothetical protein